MQPVNPTETNVAQEVLSSTEIGDCSTNCDRIVEDTDFKWFVFAVGGDAVLPHAALQVIIWELNA